MEEIEGEGRPNGTSMRRPMNAFLIFCKRHRSLVREKNPHLDNRSITRILGDIWANLGTEEKSTYINLAKQYKEAFLKAHPDYKWFNPDKHGSSTAASSGSRQSARPSNAVNSMLTNGDESKEDDATISHKLADPSDMGGLSLLLMAGQQQQQQTPTPLVFTAKVTDPSAQGCIIQDEAKKSNGLTVDLSTVATTAAAPNGQLSTSHAAESISSPVQSSLMSSALTDIAAKSLSSKSPESTPAPLTSWSGSSIPSSSPSSSSASQETMHQPNAKSFPRHPKKLALMQHSEQMMSSQIKPAVNATSTSPPSSSPSLEYPGKSRSVRELLADAHSARLARQPSASSSSMPERGTGKERNSSLPDYPISSQRRLLTPFIPNAIPGSELGKMVMEKVIETVYSREFDVTPSKTDKPFIDVQRISQLASSTSSQLQTMPPAAVSAPPAPRTLPLKKAIITQVREEEMRAKEQKQNGLTPAPKPSPLPLSTVTKPTHKEAAGADKLKASVRLPAKPSSGVTFGELQESVIRKAVQESYFTSVVSKPVTVPAETLAASPTVASVASVNPVLPVAFYPSPIACTSATSTPPVSSQGVSMATISLASSAPLPVPLAVSWPPSHPPPPKDMRLFPAPQQQPIRANDPVIGSFPSSQRHVVEAPPTQPLQVPPPGMAKKPRHSKEAANGKKRKVKATCYDVPLPEKITKTEANSSPPHEVQMRARAMSESEMFRSVSRSAVRQVLRDRIREGLHHQHQQMSQPNGADSVMRPMEEDADSRESVEEEIESGVRKSKRSNRGQRYQQLISQGILHSARKKSDSTSAGSEDANNNSNMSQGDNQTSGMASSSASSSSSQDVSFASATFCRRRTVSEMSADGNESTKRYISGDFDLEAHIASLPACEMVAARKVCPKSPRGRSRHHSEPASRGTSKEPLMGRDPFAAEDKKLAFGSTKKESNDVKTLNIVELRQLCKRTEENPKPTPLVGSQKRKARKFSITHLVAVAPEKKPDVPQVDENTPCSLPTKPKMEDEVTTMRSYSSACVNLNALADIAITDNQKIRPNPVPVTASTQVGKPLAVSCT